MTRKEQHIIRDPGGFAERINPRNFNFSPKLAAIVGAIIGHDYGVTDRKGGRLTGLSITSDGFVIAGSTAHESGAFIGHVSDLERNLDVFKAELTPADRLEFERLYQTNVKDWRSGYPGRPAPGSLTRNGNPA